MIFFHSLDRQSESLHLRIRSEHPPLSSRLPTVLSSFLSTIHRNDLLKTKLPYVYSNAIFFDNDQFVYLNTTERSFCQPLQIVYSLSFSLTLQHLTRSAVLHNDIEDINLDHYEAHHSSTTLSSHFTDFYNEPSQSYYYEDAFTHTLFSFTEAIEEDNVYSFIKKYKFLVDEDEDVFFPLPARP